MRPDRGVYEERYRLTGQAALSVAVALGLLAFSLHGTHGKFWLVLSLLTFAVVALPMLATAISRRVAFRADPLGITLGASPMSWPGLGGGAVFIPWTEVERIVLYQGPKQGAAGRLCVGIQRRPGAPPLPSGNEPATRCPVPGLAEGAIRQTVAWRLDREQLTAYAAAVAPGVPVIDVGSGGPAVEGPGAGGTAVEGPGADG